MLLLEVFDLLLNAYGEQDWWPVDREYHLRAEKRSEGGKTMKKILIAGTVASVAFASDWDLEAPAGLKFGVIKGYEDWHVVATHYRTDKNELRYIIGNDVAVKAYRSGIPLNGKKKINSRREVKADLPAL